MMPEALVRRGFGMAGLPTGTVTFLFTDIEGSTRISQEYREVWEKLQARHHTILRSAIEAQGGHVFQIIGDAFCAAFNQPGGALRAALKAQRDLQAEPWGEVPLRVRMGIHTGVANVDSDDYRGYLALSSAQRVMSAGHGGQVLLSQAAFDLIDADPPEDIGLRDMGQHRLKDLLRPQHLYQLVVAELPSDFPPLKTLDLHPHNLPVQLTSFVGRDQEIREIPDYLRRARLVTLTGVGGTGKTRLALQVAAEVLPDFPDGAWLVELAPLTDPALVAATIAAALNVHEQAGRPVIETLKDYLSNKSLLLVLDNCEHLLDQSAAAADALLRTSPASRVLATSREALGLGGETAYPVHSLPLPVASAVTPLALSQCDAGRLFIERAAAVQPGFRVSEHNVSAVADICTRLDGIPLAIELAAARVKALAIEQIAQRLDHRFRLLTGGSRMALPRQRTLQATLDWSYNLLSTDERTVLRRLSVFAGGWTIEAAEHVCAGGDLDRSRVLDSLTGIVEKSLAVLDPEAGRYSMLQTVREYALEKLGEAGEEAQIRSRHLDHWLALVRSANLEAAQDEAALALLAQDHQNLVAAIKWCDVADEGAEKGMELMGSTRLYWVFLGQYELAYQLSRNVLTLPGAQTRNLARERALRALGQMATFAGHSAGVMETLQESLAIAKELSDTRGVAECLHELGNASTFQGNDIAAIPYFEQAFELARGLGNDLLTGMVLNNWAECLRAAGDLAAAESRYEEAFRYKRQANNPYAISVSLLCLARVDILRDRLPRAKERLLEVLRLISDSRFPARPAQYAVEVCAAFMGAAGDWWNAARLYGACETELHKAGEARGRADDQLIVRFVEEARDALGEVEYARAVQEGSRLGTQDALSEVVAWLGRWQ